MASDSPVNASLGPQTAAGSSANAPQSGVGPAGAPKDPKTSQPGTQPQTPHHAPHQAHPHYSAAKFPPAELVATLENGTNVKRRVPRMRACDEKDEKGEICAGHLKRWFHASPQIIQQFGDELYVCERCRTIYLPNSNEAPRSGTLAW